MTNRTRRTMDIITANQILNDHFEEVDGYEDVREYSPFLVAIDTIQSALRERQEALDYITRIADGSLDQ